MKRKRRTVLSLMVLFCLAVIVLYVIRIRIREQPKLGEKPDRTPSIAVTFDDLPGVGSLREGESRQAMNSRLLKALVDRDVPATGFVNCGRVRKHDTILTAWLDAGMELGNHTSNHLDLNTVDVATWSEDVRTCDELLREYTGRPVRFFRYPLLHRGETVEKRDAGFEALNRLGYTIAPVTVDNSDYLLALAYSKAINEDDAARQQIVEAYQSHIIEAVVHYQDVAREVCGRDIRHILLLHANSLAADHVGKVLDTLSAMGFRFVSLEEALEDPVYSRPDLYAGRKGVSWLYRIEEHGENRAGWDTEQTRLLTERFIAR